MNTSLSDAVEEIKRVDHLVFVSLKYTRTVDVIKSVVDRIISALDFIFIALWIAEFIVPYYAESHTQTHFHSEHIEERFGLLTIIVLGESVLASTNSFITLIEHFSYDILLVSIGCLFTLFGIWWLYFNNSVEHELRNKNFAF